MLKNGVKRKHKRVSSLRVGRREGNQQNMLMQMLWEVHHLDFSFHTWVYIQVLTFMK